MSDEQGSKPTYFNCLTYKFYGASMNSSYIFQFLENNAFVIMLYSFEMMISQNGFITKLDKKKKWRSCVTGKNTNEPWFLL